MRAWQKTCLPASSAEIVTAECMYGGVPIQTMSMSGSATRSGQCFIGIAPGKFSLQNFSELSYVELETATISTSAFADRPWATALISAGALAGITSVLLVF